MSSIRSWGYFKMAKGFGLILLLMGISLYLYSLLELIESLNDMVFLLIGMVAMIFFTFGIILLLDLKSKTK